MRKKVFQLSMFIISLTLVMGLFINVTNQNQVEAKDESQSGPETLLRLLEGCARRSDRDSGGDDFRFADCASGADADFGEPSDLLHDDG